MKKYTLNEKIIVYLTLNYEADEPTYVSYRIMDNLTSEIIYTGRVFYDKGERVKEIYLNDIFEGLKDKDWYKYISLTNNFNENPDVTTLYKYGLYCNIDDVGDLDFIQGQDLFVLLEHPQRLMYNDEYIEASLDNAYKVLPVLSGIEGDYDDKSNTFFAKPALIPTIPYRYVGNPLNNMYGIVLSSDIDLYGTQVQYGTLNGKTFTSKGKLVVHPTYPTQVASVGFMYNLFDKGDVIALSYNNENPAIDKPDTFVTVAKIDCGDSKYYLSWFDRCGGVQMQPFCKTDKRTATYDTIYKVNQYNETETLNISVTDQIELNTGWIDERLLPYYEHIFVSPYLSLWDNTIFQDFMVTITNKSFEYKTFKNQGRRLFNLNLTVEISQKEKILY